MTGLIVNEITLITTAKIVDGKTITGDGAITLTALGVTRQRTIGITVTGTKTVNVATTSHSQATSAHLRSQSILERLSRQLQPMRLAAR